MRHESVSNKVSDKTRYSWLHWHGMIQDSEVILRKNSTGVWLFAGCVLFICWHCVFGAQVCVCLHWFGGSFDCAACWKLFRVTWSKWEPMLVTVSLWTSPVCFSGAGLGLLPFSVSPVTPTASTNCDSGTHSSTELSLSVSHNMVWVCVWRKCLTLLSLSGLMLFSFHSSESIDLVFETFCF